MPKNLRLLTAALACSAVAATAQQAVTIPLPTTPGQLHADLYGTGRRAVILAHGGRFAKESWKDQADSLARSGLLVLAISFRGDRPNPNGSPGSFGSAEDNAQDVLAAVAWLHAKGIRDVSAVGASFGGDAVGDADAQLPPGALTRIVFLASSGGDHPEKLTGQKLFILAEDDRSASGPRLPEISDHYARMPEPKRLVLLKGSAHAQFLFPTEQGPRLLKEITAFLLTGTEPPAQP